MHRIEAPEMADYRESGGLYASDMENLVEGLRKAGYAVPDTLVTAVPEGFDPAEYRVTSTSVTRTVDEGDSIDLGDRHFEVLHLPGHSPGSIGLFEAATETLFSGDAIYDGPLLDELVRYSYFIGRPPGVSKGVPFETSSADVENSRRGHVVLDFSRFRGFLRRDGLKLDS